MFFKSYALWFHVKISNNIKHFFFLRHLKLLSANWIKIVKNLLQKNKKFNSNMPETFF